MVFKTLTPEEFQKVVEGLKKSISSTKDKAVFEIVQGDDEKRVATSQDTLEQTLKERETERGGREQYYALRRHWSWFLFSFLCAQLIFQFIVTFLIGFGLLDFTHYSAFLAGVIIESFLQIVGMCLVVVQFLFSDRILK